MKQAPSLFNRKPHVYVTKEQQGRSDVFKFFVNIIIPLHDNETNFELVVKNPVVGDPVKIEVELIDLGTTGGAAFLEGTTTFTDTLPSASEGELKAMHVILKNASSVLGTTIVRHEDAEIKTIDD